MAQTQISKSEFQKHQDFLDILDTIHDDIVSLRNTLGNVLVGSVTWDPASVAAIATGGVATTTITVTGAAVGDFVLASFSLDLQNLTLTGYVNAANTVTLQLSNNTTGAVNLASGTARAYVIPQAAVALAAKLLSK